MARRVYKQVQGSRKFTYCFLQSARDEFPLHFTLAQTAKFNGNYFVRLLKSQKYLQVQITFVLFESFTKLFNFMKKAYLKKWKKKQTFNENEKTILKQNRTQKIKFALYPEVWTSVLCKLKTNYRHIGVSFHCQSWSWFVFRRRLAKLDVRQEVCAEDVAQCHLWC